MSRPPTSNPPPTPFEPTSPRGALPAWVGWALWAGTMVVYLLSATTHLVGADNGEFVILAAQGGRAHPPGYPLYVLYLQATSWLPAQNPAHAAALATAILGAASVAILYRAARCWGASDAASLLAAMGFALSPQIWFLNTHAEAFAPNNFLAALLIWLAAPRGPFRGAPRMLALGLVAGLGLSNHHSIILLAPVGFYGIYLGFREAARPVIALAASAAALGAGLLPYLQLFAAADCARCFQWGEISTLNDIVGHFLRRDYGTATLAPNAGGPKPLIHTVTLIREVAADFALVGLLLGIVGMVWAVSKRRLFADSIIADPTNSTGSKASRLARPVQGARWLLFSFILAGPAFVLLFNLPPVGAGLEIIRRFYALPELLLAVFVAFGIDATRPLWRGRPGWLRDGVAAMIFGVLIVSSLIRLDAYYRPTLEIYARHTLEPLPKGAILVGSGDARFLSIEYLRRIKGVRRDIPFLHANLLRFDWYAADVEENLERRFHTQIELDAPVGAAELAGALVGTNQPIFWADPPADKLDGFVLYPHGTASRLLPPGAQLPAAGQLLETNRRILAEFELGEPPPPRINPWGWWLYAQYPGVWFDIAEICKRSGNASCKRLALERAQAFNAMNR